MKKVLFLFDDASLEKPHSTQGFTTTTSQLIPGADVYLGQLDQLEYTVSDNGASVFDPKNGHDLKDYDLVYFRSWAASKAFTGISALYLDHHKVKYFDSEAATHRSFSKLDQYFKLWRAGLPVPATFYGSVGAIKRKVGQELFKLPVILKSYIGARGSDNHLAKSMEEVNSILANPPEDGGFMLQQYIPNSSDYRVLVLGGVPKLVIKRTRDVSKTHLNNTSKGASAEIIDIKDMDKKIIEDSVMAAQVLKREIAGVDVVIDETSGKHYFFEINRKPQLNEGVFIDEKMEIFADYIAKNL